MREWAEMKDEATERRRSDDAQRWNDERDRTLFDLGPVAAATLPLAMTREPAVTAPGLRILVVDDNRDSAAMLAMLLQFSGHETHTAHDRMEAVDATAKLQPDVILLDIGLPRLNGYEAARRIRERQNQPGRPLLVALTGWGQDEDRRRSEEAGFDAHLVKPVDEAALGKLLADLAANRQGGNGPRLAVTTPATTPGGRLPCARSCSS